jgi:hypothetical protein
MLVLHALMNAHISWTVVASITPLHQSPMCQYSSDNGHATDWHLVHIGVRSLSSLVSVLDRTNGIRFCGLCWANRDLRRAVPVESSWKRLRSCQRAASPQRTQVSGRTRRSRLSSGSSTLCILRGPRLGSSFRMRAARPRHSPRGSSRAQIASTVRIPRLPLLTRVDGLTTVRHTCVRFVRCSFDVSSSQSMGL